LRWTVRRTVDHAAKVLTVSEFSRRAILKVYGHLDEDKVVVAHNAAGAEFRPVSREAAQTAIVRERFGVLRPFLLSVGDLQPRKNQIGLIRRLPAGARLPATESRPGAGREGDLVRRIKCGGGARIGRRRSHPFLGFVSDADLLQLYNACDLFVFPSFYEGFGLPALEAMACGRAVACSPNASALPEVVDSAAIVFDPYRTDEMVRAIGTCCWTRNCGRAWSGWVCSAPRTSVGRRPPTPRLDVFREVALEGRLEKFPVPATIAHR
jgi:glycosyltransferase involved in cell wall biosynthesis